MTTRRTLLILALLFELMVPDRRSFAAKPEIWFGPNYRVRLHDNVFLTPADYMDMFRLDRESDNRWLRFRVFKVYAMFLKREPEDTLREMFAWLRSHGIALAVEYGPLQPQDCGTGVEGFDGPQSARAISNRARKAGGKIDYVAMDEPFWHSSHSPKPNACHWTLERIAQNAAASVKVFKEIFPKVLIGDIEPIADLPGADLGNEIGEWADDFKAATGDRLAFFHADILWDRPWMSSMKQVADAMTRRNIPLGIIYSGDFHCNSDSEWFASLNERSRFYSAAGEPQPQDIILQSWSKYPDHILPPSDPSSFSHQLMILDLSK